MTIEMDSDIDEAMLATAEEAIARWDARAEVRKARNEALAARRPLEADTRTRLAARVNNLVADVRLSSRGRRPPSNPTLKALVERPTPVTPEEIDESIVQEVVVGARDFLSIEFLERGLLASRSVGRVLVSSGSGLKARGTGFLVAPGLLLTNHHVLTSRELALVCSVEMDYEQNRLGPPKHPQVFSFEPDRFFLNDAALDYALVAVAATSDRSVALANYGWLTLNAAQGKIVVSDQDYLNIIQHPLGREKEVVIRNNRILDLRTSNDAAADALGPFLHYEGDTEKGSSGSPVLNDQWNVVALHHSGVPARDTQGNWLDKEGHVWRRGQQSISEIRWVANEAIRVSSLVAAISIAPVAPHEHDLFSQLLSAQPPTRIGDRSEAAETLGEAQPSPAVREREPERRRRPLAVTQPGIPPRRPSGPPASATIELPLRITISLGAERLLRQAVRGSAQMDRPTLEEALEPEDFADRDGYDRAFLGVTVPLPMVKPEPRFGGALRVPRPARAGDTHELRYHHYSVIMCASRRLAYVSACNANFRAAVNASRDQGTDSWRNDPRIDGRHQLSSLYYNHNDYDKGHLTRRDDAAWGNTLAEAIAANNDTFLYPNAAPQHFLLNQSDDFTHAGLDLWGDLEEFISGQAGGQRLTLFNGCIFGDEDKPLHDALVPLSFYKIVVWRDARANPGAVGFVLQQDDLVASLSEEAIDPGRFEIRQRRIADIEAMLDIDFGPVKDWDLLAGARPEEGIEEDGVLIRSLDDVLLQFSPTATR